LVGIISRADLVRALAEMAVASTAPRSGNGQLQKLIWEQIRQQPWLQSVYLNLSVKEGVVELYGAVQSQDQRRALLVLVNRVPGVRRVEDALTVMPRVIAA
jgi:osmotically-inducible protein OsmY